MNINALPIRAYKGFHKDMTCNDFQYEQGKEYNCSDAILCETGFHACINPLEVWQYYPPTLMGRYCEVELSGFVDSDPRYSKICGTHIKIGREIDVSQMAEEFVKEYLGKYYDEKHTIILHERLMRLHKKRVKCINSGHVINRRDISFMATKRSNIVITNKGDSAVIASNATYGEIHIYGIDVVIGNGGTNSNIANFGYNSRISNYAEHSTISNHGDYSTICNSGANATIVDNSCHSYIISTGQDCQICLFCERSVVNAAAGTTLVCQTWDGKHKTFVVGEDDIYPNRDYKWNDIGWLVRQ